MKICEPHWDLLRKAVDERGMTSLVARDGKAALDNMVAELQGGAPADFDPLMALNNHFWFEVLRCGGLYLMAQDPSGANDGHYCPLCEFEKHSNGFVAADAVATVADQIAEHCRAQGLLPKVQ